ncbi:unnamed protein product [Amaranthus hypochondriacus]
MEDDEAESPSLINLDKDTTLLSKVAANHLFLTQFEAFRATILSLRHRNPNLALSILQTIVINGGNFNNIIYSTNCSSPALLTWLSSLELFQYENSTSIWSNARSSTDFLRLRVEFLLYIQMVISRVFESVDRVRVEEELNELKSSLRLLDEVMESGFRRLKEDSVISLNDDRVNVMIVKEEELGCLRKVILDNADIFMSLCENIQGQVGMELEHDDNELAITLKRESRAGLWKKEDFRGVLMVVVVVVVVVMVVEGRNGGD